MRSTNVHLRLDSCRLVHALLERRELEPSKHVLGSHLSHFSQITRTLFAVLGMLRSTVQRPQDLESFIILWVLLEHFLKALLRFGAISLVNVNLTQAIVRQYKLWGLQDKKGNGLIRKNHNKFRKETRRAVANRTRLGSAQGRFAPALMLRSSA
jgi:hypothetical protein